MSRPACPPAAGAAAAAGPSDALGSRAAHDPAPGAGPEADGDADLDAGRVGGRGRTVRAEPLTAAAFAPFGEVIEAAGAPDMLINAGLCGRHHDLARLDFAGGRAGISVFDAKPRALPHAVDLLERHPEGSQAFVPMHAHPFLVVVASDEGGAPGRPRAFLTAPGQGVNLRRGVWHGVLTPLHAPGLFAVVDRIGEGGNLEEHRLQEPWVVERGAG